MKLALGTAQFGLDYGIANRHGKVSKGEAKSVLALAKASGMDSLDTAISYGDSECRLGELGIEDWMVVSKLPSTPRHCHDIFHWVISTVNRSLQRLRVKSLAGLLLHQPRQLLERDGDQLYCALQQLKDDGLVRKFGVSVYDPSDLDLICNRYQLDIVQAPLNILDHRLIDSGWVTRLPEHGTELHVRSVFLQGLLLLTAKERPQKFSRWQAHWERWDDGLAARHLGPLEVCLSYVLSFPQISKVIVGVDNCKQLLQILSAPKTQPIEWLESLGTPDAALLNPSNWSRL